VKALGEFVIVVAGNSGEAQPAVKALTREAVLKTLGISRNELYDLFFNKREKS
jgi:predicted DNA-binding transcriptional regulator AlpA